MNRICFIQIIGIYLFVKQTSTNSKIFLLILEGLFCLFNLKYSNFYYKLIFIKHSQKVYKMKSPSRRGAFRCQKSIIKTLFNNDFFANCSGSCLHTNNVGASTHVAHR